MSVVAGSGRPPAGMGSPDRPGTGNQGRQVAMSASNAGKPKVRILRQSAWVAALLLSAALPASAQDVAAAEAKSNGIWKIVPDRTAPIIRSFSPADGSQGADPHLPIQFEVADPFGFGVITSRLDVNSVQFTVNGVDHAGDMDIERLDWLPPVPWFPPQRARVTYAPQAAAPLPEGLVAYRFSMADRAGNRVEREGSFLVDTQGPVITALVPEDGASITDLLTPLTFGITDEGSGLDAATIAVSVNGAPQVDGWSIEDGRLTLSPPTGGWPEGELSVAIQAADGLGNSRVAQFTYTVVFRVDLAAYPRAIPASGDAPLTVTFVPDVVTSTAVERYQWDFQGDGTFERSETVGRNQSFTYTTPGNYDAALRITDTRGEIATGTVRVVVGNKPPVVSAEASPSNGAPPLLVAFTATASDSNGIASYEWDFEGDGTYDSSGPGNTASHTYSGEGVFRPRIRVTDTLGAATELSVPTVEVRVEEGAPTVTASASPGVGNAPLLVNFSGSAVDPEGQAITGWRWDHDGDGSFDQDTATASSSHTYTAPGTYYARVQATTADGRSGLDIVKIVVNLSLSLRVVGDTIDADLAGSSTIESTLGGDTQVSLVVETPAAAVVRTLVPWGLRNAGTYSDVWDGRDDEGELLPEGQYRAVLLYRIDGVERRFDLGQTTGGAQSNPPRTSMPSRFSPLAGQPLKITYTLSRASEVTAFMGRFNVNTRLVTFLQRVPQGKGSHTIVWNGENSDGQMIHPPSGDSFLFGIFAYTLPDNAIYLRSGVHASALVVTPSILDPTGSALDSTPVLSTLAFNLNRSGSVELSVYDAETGALVRRQQFDGLAGGAQTVNWDGRDNAGALVAPGRYRLGVTGVSGSGGRSTTIYALQRVYY